MSGKQSRKKLSILVVGKAGVGKATWINGFVNYFSYNTLGEAVTNETICPIPISFSIAEQLFALKIHDSNENVQTTSGSTHTNLLKRYSCVYNDVLVEIIDSPSFGNPLGVEEDMKTVRNISNETEELDKLHGCCILLEPNAVLLDETFQKCLKNLLESFPKGFHKNIVFCFTNSRITWNRVGNTRYALEKFLNENTINIALNKETMFCTENESVRFLAEAKSGIQDVSLDQLIEFSNSWKFSMNETKRMVDHISSLQTHLVKKTLTHVEFVDRQLPISSIMPTNCDGKINILLLGETGVGKSTWINGIANYLWFQSLGEAEASNTIVCPIPIFFEMSVVVDNEYQYRKVTLGDKDENEHANAVLSCTQFPKTYCFENGDTTLRLIDTPGIGDTSGIERDKENFKHILSYVATFEKLHGICVLLKPNDTRYTVMVQYCIKELLANLHKDACRNIVFCFTNSKITDFTPGGTLLILKKLLEDNEINVNISPDTVYCIDNEAMRYLAAVKSGITYDREGLSKCWDKSVETTKRLVKRISSLEPHAVKNTLSINDTRHMLLFFPKALTEISANIQKNISSIQNSKEELQNTTIEKRQLERHLSRKQFETKAVVLNRAQRVCLSDKCVTMRTIGDENIPVYKCSQKTAWLFKEDSSKTNCEQCGCKMENHSNTTYVVFEIEKKEEQIVKADNHMESMNKEVRELQEEQKQITDTGAQFAKFLKMNAITPYNDATGDYFDYVIRAKKDKKVIDRLVEIKNEHQAEMKRLEETMKAVGSLEDTPTPDDVRKLIDKLYAMKHNGRMIRDTVTVAEAAEMNYVDAREISIQINPSRQK